MARATIRSTTLPEDGREPSRVGLHDALPGLLPSLRSLARRILRDPDEAMDVAHDAAVRALSARDVPVDRLAYRAWLHRIARNAAVDAIRRRPRVAEAVENESADPWLCERALITNLSVRRAMMRLTPDHRGVLLLVDVEELSYAEAAVRLSVPVGTVMSRVARARASLLRALESGRSW